ncbi:hypothetical protein [Kaistella palustris]|uniref:hypothetical protein n=1 Tax=Kaistella palustris TaxID=493376 RepID=UPI0004892AC1|nr:hypothetical protein [Kaistella palustris]
MTARKPFRKFSPKQKEIEELEKKCPKFKRIYSEYELINDELWTVQTDSAHSIPDDFVEAMKIQSDYLEHAIDDLLLEEYHLPQ